MSGIVPWRVLVCLASLLVGATIAHARLKFEVEPLGNGTSYVFVSGEFDYRDDLSTFETLVRSNNSRAVTFHSPGGNIAKAMELGRLIRRLGLLTIQPRFKECSSACSLAFFGGTDRVAQPGAIGVHKSSFSGDLPINTEDAVSAVQQMTAEIVTYMIEMGVDPSLLQVSLQYDSNDIRYLSRSEMRKFRVTTDNSDAPPPQAARPDSGPARLPNEKTTPLDATGLIPLARSGRVRHPGGRAPLKAEPNGKAADIANLPNRTAVMIDGSVDRWYRIRTSGRTGYMHHTWVFVDQFAGGQFDMRHIQVKSLSTEKAAEAYVRSSAIPLAAYLATNGWFAITLDETFEPEIATKLLKRLKEAGSIPDDSFVVYGNTYIRKACCD